jgi:hypothetical protein
MCSGSSIDWRLVKNKAPDDAMEKEMLPKKKTEVGLIPSVEG